MYLSDFYNHFDTHLSDWIFHRSKLYDSPQAEPFTVSNAGADQFPFGARQT